jgi:hypothetical protein
MSVSPGTVHQKCGGRFYRTMINGNPAVRCGGCGFTKYAGTSVDRGVRVHNPWEQTEKEAQRG